MGVTVKSMALIKTKNGFTLVELLLYVSIASIMLLVISIFLTNLLQSRIKNQTIAEVDGQGGLIMQIITQATRNAENVTSPAPGATASSMILDVLHTAADPTVFDIFGGTIRISEGNGNTIALSNTRVTATNLIFKNVSRPDTPGTVQIQFTLTHANTENRNEYDYRRTFTGSATLRHP